MPWFAIRVQPGREIPLIEQWTASDVEAFTPKYLARWLGPRGVAIERTMALFPGYAFVRVASFATAWTILTAEDGFRGAVYGTGSEEEFEPESLPNVVMDALRARCDASGLWIDALGPPPLPKIVIGQSFTVTVGPFAGRHAVCDGGSGQWVRGIFSGELQFGPLQRSGVVVRVLRSLCVPLDDVPAAPLSAALHRKRKRRGGKYIHLVVKSKRLRNE